MARVLLRSEPVSRTNQTKAHCVIQKKSPSKNQLVQSCLEQHYDTRISNGTASFRTVNLTDVSVATTDDTQHHILLCCHQSLITLPSLLEALLLDDLRSPSKFHELVVSVEPHVAWHDGSIPLATISKSIGIAGITSGAGLLNSMMERLRYNDTIHVTCFTKLDERVNQKLDNITNDVVVIHDCPETGFDMPGIVDWEMLIDK
jgi:hypothetical protein